MRFGIFLAPFHRLGENPTLAYERDLELVEDLDRLGFDEVFVGEHHSTGWETIPSPEIFMAAASQRTRRIMLGSGVVSVPYHHPYHIASRFAFLDHLTRGRVMLGCGPGQLPADAEMLGVDVMQQRNRLVEGLGVVLRLFTEDEPISIDGSWFQMKDAMLQVKPYQKPTMPIFVASSISPSGMVAAGTHGTGVLQVAAFSKGGLEGIEGRWKIAEEVAAEHGKTVDRANWRLVFPMHLAESKTGAFDEARTGGNAWIQDYFVRTIGLRQAFEDRPGQPIEEMSLESMEARGGCIVGTPDDAIRRIEELQEVTGGFGGLCFLAHEWASSEATRRSYELFARYVMPRFQGHLGPLEQSNEWAQKRQALLLGKVTAGVVGAMKDYADKKREPAAG